MPTVPLLSNCAKTGADGPNVRLILRQASLAMYADALTKLAVWFHALDYTNYTRWILVHLRDMVELPTTHLEIAEKF